MIRRLITFPNVIYLRDRPGLERPNCNLRATAFTAFEKKKFPRPAGRRAIIGEQQKRRRYLLRHSPRSVLGQSRET